MYIDCHSLGILDPKCRAWSLSGIKCWSISATKKENIVLMGVCVGMFQVKLSIFSFIFMLEEHLMSTCLHKILIVNKFVVWRAGKDMHVLMLVDGLYCPLFCVIPSQTLIKKTNSFSVAYYVQFNSITLCLHQFSELIWAVLCFL